MNYKRLKQIIGALLVGAGLVSIFWILSGRNMEAIGLLAMAALMVMGGLLHVFAPGEEPKTVLSKLVEEVKDADGS